MGFFEIVLFVLGIIFLIVSFFVGDKSSVAQPLPQGDRELTAEETLKLRQEAETVFAALTEQETNAVKETLDQLCNEKIMSIDEFSRQVLERITHNNEEVVFLHGMLQDKEEALKTDLARLEQLRKQCEALSEQEEALRTEQLEKMEEFGKRLKERERFFGATVPQRRSGSAQAGLPASSVSPKEEEMRLMKMLEARTAAAKESGQQERAGQAMKTQKQAVQTTQMQQQAGQTMQTRQAMKPVQTGGIATQQQAGQTTRMQKQSGQTTQMQQQAGQATQIQQARKPVQTGGIAKQVKTEVQSAFRLEKKWGLSEVWPLMQEEKSVVPTPDELPVFRKREDTNSERNRLERLSREMAESSKRQEVHSMRIAAARDVDLEQETDASDRNERILRLHGQRKSVLEISRLLGVGQGEVRLVIDLYGGK